MTEITDRGLIWYSSNLWVSEFDGDFWVKGSNMSWKNLTNFHLGDKNFCFGLICLLFCRFAVAFRFCHLRTLC